MYDEINQIQRRIRKIQDCIYSDAQTKKTGTSRPRNRDPSTLTHERLRSFNNSKGYYNSGPSSEDLITLDGSDPSTEDFITFDDADDSSYPGWERFGANNPYVNSGYPYDNINQNLNTV